MLACLRSPVAILRFPTEHRINLHFLLRVSWPMCSCVSIRQFVMELFALRRKPHSRFQLRNRPCRITSGQLYFPEIVV